MICFNYLAFKNVLVHSWHVFIVRLTGSRMGSLFSIFMLLIPMVSIMGLAYLVSILLKKPISYSLSPTLSIIIGCLYFALIFEVLEITAMLLLLVGIIVPSIIKFSRLGHLTVSQNLSSTTLLFLIMFFSSLVLVLSNKPIFYWDDFTHWAFLVKELVFFDGIKRDLNIYYEYPPGTAVFSYFFLKPYGVFFPKEFAESLALTSQVTLCLGFFAHPLNTIYIRNKVYALFFCIFLIIICYTVGEGFSSMMVDHILGCIFAASVCCLILRNDDEDWLFPSLSSAVTLTMIKSSGIILSFFIIFIISLIILAKLKGKNKNYNTIYKIMKKLSAVAIAFAFCLIIRDFWNSFLDYKNLSFGFQKNLSITEVLIGLFEPSGDLRLINSVFFDAIIPRFDNLENFLRASTNNPFQWPIYLSILLTLFLMTKISATLEDYIIVIGLFFGFVFFMAGLLILYQNSFTSGDGILLASFGRYVNQYAISILLIPLCLVFKVNGISRCIFLPIVFLACLPYVINPTTGIRLLEYSGITNNNKNFLDGLRLKFSKLSSNRDMLISKNISKVLSIWPCNDGYPPILARFDLHPVKLIYLQILGPLCKSKSFSTEDEKKIMILKEIEKYNYIYILQSDPWLEKVFANKIIGLSNETRNEFFEKNNISGYFQPVE